ncbi:MAG: thiamine-binding protein [Actinomycetota bacterium]
MRAEFTIFPFVQAPGLPPYVQVAVDAARATGVPVDVGPLSNVIEGTAEAVLDAIRAAQSAAFAAGATRFSLNVETIA